MNSKFMSLSWVDIKSGLVSGFIVAILVALVYIKSLGSIYLIDWKVLLDTVVMALVTFGASILKSLFTDETGIFAGIIKVKSDTNITN